jgi:hypothetical protein
MSHVMDAAGLVAGADIAVHMGLVFDMMSYISASLLKT